MDLLNFQLVDVTDFFNKVFHLDPNSEGSKPLTSKIEFYETQIFFKPIVTEAN